MNTASPLQSMVAAAALLLTAARPAKASCSQQ